MVWTSFHREFTSRSLPIAFIVIAALFFLQRGTGTIGPRLRARHADLVPLPSASSAWMQIIHHPFVLVALIPHLQPPFHFPPSQIVFVALGAVVLAVTGRRGAVCRYEPFRPPPHPRGLDLFRSALPGVELFRPRRVGHRGPLAIDNPFYKLAPHAWICRSSSSPHWRQSSPARPSSPALSRWPGMSFSSACSRAWKFATPPRHGTGQITFPR